MFVCGCAICNIYRMCIYLYNVHILYVCICINNKCIYDIKYILYIVYANIICKYNICIYIYNICIYYISIYNIYVYRIYVFHNVCIYNICICIYNIYIYVYINMYI